MRILAWFYGYWPQIGGSETLGRELLSSLRQRGHEIQVIAAHDPRLPAVMEDRGIRIQRLPFGQTLRHRDLVGIASIKRQVETMRREFRPDVHLNFSNYIQEAFLHETMAADDAPIVVTLHDAWERRLMVPPGTVGRTLWRASFIATPSEATRRDLLAIHPHMAAKSEAVVNALPPPPRPASGIPEGPPRLLCVGRMVTTKGYDLAVRGFARLALRHPTLRLGLVGDGDQRLPLIELARQLGVGDRVDAPGFVPPDDLWDWFAASTCVVVPSRMEGFGLTALEAAQMARPVVGTSVGGLCEAVRHGETGLLVPMEDLDALTAGIERVLTEPGLAQRLGEAGHARVRREFNWDRFVERYESILLEAARNPRLPEAPPVQEAARP